jgi:hypothetical protein
VRQCYTFPLVLWFVPACRCDVSAYGFKAQGRRRHLPPTSPVARPIHCDHYYKTPHYDYAHMTQITSKAKLPQNYFIITRIFSFAHLPYCAFAFSVWPLCNCVFTYLCFWVGFYAIAFPLPKSSEPWRQGCKEPSRWPAAKTLPHLWTYLRLHLLCNCVFICVCPSLLSEPWRRALLERKRELGF